MTQRRVIVIGAGAAGTMAAIFAASEGAQVTLLERTRDGGRKILISGGGRCNVLPTELDETRYITDSSANTMRKMLRSWPLAEQREFFERDVGIALVDEPDSRKVFPASHKARDVRDGLLALARRRGASVEFETQVTGLARDGDAWRVSCADGRTYDASAVIMATGGLSVPTTGSDGTGLRVVEELGHAMHPTYAALTPVTASPAPFGGLSDISLTVGITATSDRRTASARGGFLFTHVGYSGPSVLDVSHVVVRARAESRQADTALTVQWAPLDDAAWLERLKPQGSRTVLGVVRAELPDRLATALLDVARVPHDRTVSELQRDERQRLVDALVRGSLPWTGDEGYRKAEVTGGGVSLAEVDPRTMESRRCAGLYLCGEILDAFGPIGGYNFCWAWATGRAAGLGASRA